MRDLLVILVVGLTPKLLGRHTPNLEAFARRGGRRRLRPVLPAVTCSVQSTFLTGAPPSAHGIVANGWYFRDEGEVRLWRQSNRLVSGEKVWDAARRIDPAFTCANMFWWYNMYSGADIGVTPRPMYPADGRKIPDHYADPPELHDELDRLLGTFPLFRFWGPATDITSSRWIARATSHVMRTRNPTLTLCYLPHLDYDLQRWGPDPDDPRVAAALTQIDEVCGELLADARALGRDVIVLSEYGIVPVRGAVHVNRVLRDAGLLRLRVERGREHLDPGASPAFALADHQLAHVYINHPDRIGDVRRALGTADGIAAILDDDGKRRAGLAHERSGDLVLLSESDRWFSYDWWRDDDRAPDYARTVDIHRKPGYDPLELLVNPAIRFPKLRIGRKLLARRLGGRNLIDVTPLGPDSLIRGSHGLLPVDGEEVDGEDGPVLLSSRPELLPSGTAIEAAAVKALMLDHLFEPSGHLSPDRSRAAHDARDGTPFAEAWDSC